VTDASSGAGGRGERRKSSPLAEAQAHGFSDLRQYVPAEILDVKFPVSVRGYERRAVDAYIKRVNRAIAELKVSASPPAAVRHALDQAEEKVEGLLRAAREAGEEITASARREAEESTARAKAEAVELLVNSSSEADRVRGQADELLAKARTEAEETVARAKADADTIVSAATAEAQQIIERSQAEAEERFRQVEQELATLRDQAETRVRELEADTKAISQRRRELLDNIGEMAHGLLDLAEKATERLPPQLTSATVNRDTECETEPPTVATDEVTRPLAAVGLAQDPRESDGERAERTNSEPHT
jgi:DivIVA domain-containing protein